VHQLADEERGDEPGDEPGDDCERATPENESGVPRPNGSARPAGEAAELLCEQTHREEEGARDGGTHTADPPPAAPSERRKPGDTVDQTGEWSG